MCPNGLRYTIRCEEAVANREFRNQHIIKSSIPTSHAYISPSSPLADKLGTDFVMQHNCASYGLCRALS